MDGELFNCRKCRLGHHCDDDFRWTSWDDNKKQLIRSRGPAPQARFVIKDVIESRTCLLPMVTPQNRALLRLYGHFKNHLLPFPGSVMDQPAVVMEALELIGATVNQIEIERMEKRNRGRR